MGSAEAVSRAGSRAAGDRSSRSSSGAAAEGLDGEVSKGTRSISSRRCSGKSLLGVHGEGEDNGEAVPKTITTQARLGQRKISSPKTRASRVCEETSSPGRTRSTCGSSCSTRLGASTAKSSRRRSRGSHLSWTAW